MSQLAGSDWGDDASMANANATAEHGGVRDRRLAAGLSQEQLAREAGCSLNYVRLIESGYRPDWHASPKLRRVVELLGLSAADLNDARPADDRARVTTSAGQGRHETG